MKNPKTYKEEKFYDKFKVKKLNQQKPSLRKPKGGCTTQRL